MHVYVIYTPNLGLGFTVLIREREQGRYKGSRKRPRQAIMFINIQPQDHFRQKSIKNHALPQIGPNLAV